VYNAKPRNCNFIAFKVPRRNDSIRVSGRIPGTVDGNPKKFALDATTMNKQSRRRNQKKQKRE